MTRCRRMMSMMLAASIAGAGFVHSAQATLIGTEQVARAAAAQQGQAQARALSMLERSDVIEALAARGVDAQQARDRVAALTDAEAVRLADALDHAPAGGDVLGTIVFIFVLLLVTDILGFTRIFPFTRPIR